MTRETKTDSPSSQNKTFLDLFSVEAALAPKSHRAKIQSFGRAKPMTT